MIRKHLLFFLLFIAHLLVQGQVRVSTTSTLPELIQTLAGPGVKISNIKTYAPYQFNPSFGAFQDLTKSIGIGSGVLLTTGAARYAEGPNNTSSKTQINNSIYEDPDLKKLVESDVDLYDICMVEFDIVTSDNLLTFNYVFASEEYNEFTNFNDVFGFFISGPGIIGKRNLAVIPGTNIPVSVSNVNASKNSQYFINNDFYNNRTQYDGFTVPLTASVKVQPCVTYKIKLAIQDTKDKQYDSGVFLEKGSFKSETPPSLEIAYQFPHLNYGIEDCNNVKLIIKRNPTADLSLDLTYPIKIQGTAQNGIDFSSIPNEVTIPANSTQVVIDITIFQDGLKEESEVVNIIIPSVCSNFPDLASASFNIKDKFEYEIPSERICSEETVILNKAPKPSQSILWSNSPELSCLACDSPVASPETTTYYHYTITDILSQCQSNDSVLVEITAIEADFSFGFENCYTTQDLFLKNTSKNGSHFTWDFGDGNSSLEENPQHFYDVDRSSLPKKFTVHLSVQSDSPSCSSDTSKTIEITEGVFTPNLITPNKDLLNDVFKVQGIGNECWTLYIFNKWGGLIYKKENYQDNFDATDVEDGTYFYQLENGPKDRTYKGWIQIVR